MGSPMSDEGGPLALMELRERVMAPTVFDSLSEYHYYLEPCCGITCECLYMQQSSSASVRHCLKRANFTTPYEVQGEILAQQLASVTAATIFPSPQTLSPSQSVR